MKAFFNWLGDALYDIGYAFHRAAYSCYEKGGEE